MDAYEAASKAFNRCKSQSVAKNQACAPFIAKQYLIIAGVRGEALESAVEHCHRMLDEWFAKKATNSDFFPQPIEEPEVTSGFDGDSDVTDESDILA